MSTPHDSTPRDDVRMDIDKSHMKTSYANVFHVRCTADEVIICTGISLPEAVHHADGQSENVLSVELDRRIVMTPQSAQRLLLVLDNTLKEYAARFVQQPDNTRQS